MGVRATQTEIARLHLSKKMPVPPPPTPGTPIYSPDNYCLTTVPRRVGV